MFDISAHDLTHILTTYGYLAIFLVIALESAGIPLPGETMLLAASVYAGTTHRLEIALVIAVATGGAVVGDNMGYLGGRWGGYRFLHRYGPMLRIDERRLRTGEYLFQRHGGKVVFFGRFVALLRMWAAFLAGVHRMQWSRFILCNTLGGVLWAGAYGLGGYWLGSGILRFGNTISIAGMALTIGITLISLLLARRHERRLVIKIERDCQAAA